MRDEVKRFAEVMERELAANDDKGGWSGCSLSWLLSEMTNHKRELQTNAFQLQANETDTVMGSHGNPAADQALLKRILDDAADVANFAMMIADVCGALGVVNS